MHRALVLLLVITVVVIEFLATTTTVHIKVVESMWDKANHFSAFFVLYILLSLSFKEMSLFFKVVLLLGFGLQIEIVQYFIEGREFSLFDVLADSIGILIGVVFYNFYHLLRKIG
jgi:VanZ family protein